MRSTYPSSYQRNNTNSVVRRKVIIGFILSALFFFALGYQLATDGYRLKFDSKELNFKVFSNSTNSQEGDLDLTRFWNIYALIKEKYYKNEALQDTVLVDGAIRGMVESIGDPYTYYLDSSETTSFQDELNGKYEGIGVQMGYRDNNLIIVAPLDGGPAQAMGIKPGDIIIAVDGTPVANLNLGEVVAKVRGTVGTSVTLTIGRKNDEGTVKAFDVPIVREEITAPNILLTWEDGDIAYIQILRFGTGIEDEWQDIANEVKNHGVNGVLFDVRNNPGGLLDGAVSIASSFMKNGVIVSERFKNGDMKDFTTKSDGSLRDIPIVVLVNGNSASAAEILAGALRYQANAILVGQTTFGKNTVQEAYTLDGGKSIHVTVANWILPNGEIIPEDGIVPDEVVEQGNNENDDQKTRALELVREAVK